jgi:hypothetical protein
MMKTQKLLITLAVANAALLLFLLTHPHGPASQDVAPVIHGRAHQVRLAQPNLKMPDGTIGFPEIVQLRLAFLGDLLSSRLLIKMVEKRR